MTERRKTRRYDLALQAIVNSNVGTVKGRTKDISTGGLFLVLGQAVRNDTDFDVMIELPTETGVHVRAVARTVRTEEWTEQGKRVIGIGAVIGRHEIVRTAPSRRL